MLAHARIACPAVQSGGFVKYAGRPIRRFGSPCRCSAGGIPSAVQTAGLKFGVGTFDLVYRPSPGAADEVARVASPLEQLGRCLPLCWPSMIAIANWAYAWGPGSPSPLLQAALCGMGPIVMHGVLPVIDAIIGPRERHVEAFSFAPGLTAILYLLATLGTYAHVSVAPLAPLQLMLLAYTCLICLLPCFSAAHALRHQADNGINRFLATAVLSHSLLVPYLIAHSAEHHHGVGTTGDCETVSLSENLFTGGIGRCVVSQYKVAVKSSAEECRRKGQPVWSLHNKFLQAMLFQAAHAAAVAAFFGPVALALHLTVAAMGLFYWGVMFMVLHHGLDTRGQTAQAQAQAPNGTSSQAQAQAPSSSSSPVRVDHSWNSPYLLENLLLFNLLCHSQHHEVQGSDHSSSREGLIKGAPLFPAPIMALSLATLVPPLWSSIMEGRIKAVVAMQAEAV